MDITTILNAQTHARTATLQLAAARLAAGSPGSEQAISTLARAAMAEQASFARAAQAIAAAPGGLDIRA
jgi:hypothetical protein